MHGCWASTHEAPAYYFIHALQICRKGDFTGNGPRIVQANERMFYHGWACEGLLAIANIGNNRWELGKYLKEFGLEDPE